MRGGAVLLVRGTFDIVAQRYSWGIAAVIGAAVLLLLVGFVPMQTQTYAVKIDLPIAGQPR